ncbi:restriction endonuclease subunit S [Pseudaquabacterium inlustre]
MKSDCYVDAGVRVVRGTNLTGGRSFSGEFVFITPEKAAELNSANLSPNDLVFPHRGAIGEVGIVPDDGERYVLSSSLMKLTCDVDRARPDFIYYFFKSTVGRFELLKNSSQVGTPGIGQPLTSLRQIKLAVPPIGEQRKIAAVLRALDDRIALLRETNTTLEAIAQALFKSWFVDFDPVRAKSQGLAPAGMDEATAALFPEGFEESALGPVPWGWSVGKLEDLLVLQRGFDLPAQDRRSGAFPIIAASGLSGTHDEAMAKGPGVVTGRSGVLGRVFLELGDYWPLNTTLWVKEFRRASPCFAYETLRRLDFKAFNAGSAVPTLNRNHIHGLPYVLPPEHCVAAYEAVALPLHQRRRALELQAQSLAEVRDTLLPRLISGQLRLPQAEEAIAEATHAD